MNAQAPSMSLTGSTKDQSPSDRSCSMQLLIVCLGEWLRTSEQAAQDIFNPSAEVLGYVSQ